MHLRARYKKLGGHVHVRMFVGSNAQVTLGKMGDLSMTHDEWEAFLRCFQSHGNDTVDVLPEDEYVKAHAASGEV